MICPKLIFTLFLSFTSFAQNLIPNHSFEKTVDCAQKIGLLDKNVELWSSPTLGTTDIFSSCSNDLAAIPSNYNGPQDAQNGNHYAGIFAYSDNNYREYLHVKLDDTLIKGSRYSLTYYISLAERSDFAIADLAILFTDKKIKTSISRELSKKQLRKSNIKNYRYLSAVSRGFYEDRYSWMKIEIDFVANGYEEFLTLGNFKKNSKTDKKSVSSKNRFNISFYYVDNMSLINLDRPIPSNSETVLEEKIRPIEQIIYEVDRSYRFKNVNFDYDSYELSLAARNEIQNLYYYLKRFPEQKISIIGHTDNQGDADFNQRLSENRAKAVAKYLVELGLNKNFVSIIGLGNTKPVELNDTEQGRSANRRVEFKILSD